jgi:tetratricopeptide (TPR) repeat protein
VLQINPQDTKANLGLAKLCLAQRDPESAVACCQQAIAAKRDDVAAHLLLCEAYLSAGRVEDAESAYSVIAAQNEVNGSVDVVRASILQSKGEYHQAFEYLNSRRGIHVGNADFMVVFADLCLTTKRFSTGIEAVAALLNQPTTLPVYTRKRIHFALGRLYDANGEYEVAFAHFRQANDLKPPIFDRAGYAGSIQRLIDAYSVANMSRLADSGNESQLPIFIIGLPRSGTTLVEQILCSHPDVVGGGELPYIGQLAMTLSGKLGGREAYPECVASLTPELLRELADAYLLQLGRRSDSALRITDKQNGNYLHLGLIRLLVPRARVVHCRRDPMDVCLSLFTHDMGGEATYTRSFEDLAFYFRQYQYLMSHWTQGLDLSMFDISYEDLVSDQLGTTQALLDYCGLRWDDRCLEFHRSQRVVATPSHAQVRTPLYKHSVGRWKSYESELSVLRTLLGSDAQK